MASSYFSYARVWQGREFTGNYAFRLIVTDEARSILGIDGSWDHDVKDEEEHTLLKVSTRVIFQLNEVYERKFHVALRHDDDHLFIEEGNRLIVCVCDHDSFCKALLKLLES